MHDDGDEEDLEEEEAAEGGTDYEALKPRETRWLKLGHALVGQRLSRQFGAQTIVGTITKWLPADLGEGDPALFLCAHDDGDKEELEEAEADEGIALYATSAADGSAGGALPAVWRLDGHAFIGARIARDFGDGAVALATVTKWMAADAAEGEPALFHALHDDGDEEDLESEEVEEGIQEFGFMAMEKEDWRTEGHRFINQRIARPFGKRESLALATIVKWLPEDEAEGEPALFRAVHDDGDEEDLEEEEVEQGLRRITALPATRGTRHTPRA